MKRQFAGDDMKSIIARGDLHYEGTVDSSDEGIPVGNGTMASLIWTSPWSVKMQINRVDVYASNSESESFNRRNEDYSYGCAVVDIDLGQSGEAVFPKNGTQQHLSIYDGKIEIRGTDVMVNIISSQSADTFGIQIDDRRTQPGPVVVRLGMLRPSESYEKHQSAISTCESRDDAIALRQVFRDGDFYCSSAVAANGTGTNISIRYCDATGGQNEPPSSVKNRGIGRSMETAITLALNPTSQTDTDSAVAKTTVWISSAASFEETIDTVACALDIAAKAKNQGVDSIVAEAADWWKAYWSGEYVHLESASGGAEQVETHYTYFLYLMACCSRGRFAPRYGGMLFSTFGDKRAWGAQQWWTNLSLYYRGLLPTGKLEVFDAFCNHYSGVKDACAQAARQQWDSDGIYFPETIWYDGLAPLPEEIAKEMQDLYLCRKPWDSRSPRFDEYASVRHPHSSRWNWIGHGKWVDGKWTYGYNAVPPFSPVNHFLHSGGEIAYLFWKRFEYTGDRTWLETTGYPVIKGVAEFLSSFPNFVLESDGMYHVHNVNTDEHLRGVRDSFDYLIAVKGVLPVAAKAAAILDVDEAARKRWLDIAGKITSFPTTADEDSVEKGNEGEPRRFTDAREPVVNGSCRSHIEEFTSRFYDFDFGNLESRDADTGLFSIANNSFSYKFPVGVKPDTRVRVMSSLPIIAAKLGRCDDFRQAVLNLIRVLDPEADFCDYEGQGPRGALPNRMTNREGVNAIGAQRLGTTVYAVNEALCQSNPPVPGGDPVIRLFAAWPHEWDASFCLRVRGGFTVASSITGGHIGGIEISSISTEVDETCRLRNPWPGRDIVVGRSDGDEVVLKGELVEIPIKRGETVSIGPY